MNAQVHHIEGEERKINKSNNMIAIMTLIISFLMSEIYEIHNNSSQKKGAGAVNN